MSLYSAKPKFFSGVGIGIGIGIEKSSPALRSEYLDFDPDSDSDTDSEALKGSKFHVQRSRIKCIEHSAEGIG